MLKLMIYSNFKNYSSLPGVPELLPAVVLTEDGSLDTDDAKNPRFLCFGCGIPVLPWGVDDPPVEVTIVPEMPYYLPKKVKL